MKPEFLVSINNLNELEEYKKVGFSTFLFPLQNFTIGYPNTFNIEDIPYDGYILINRILDCKDVDDLKTILKSINIKGIIFEDIAVFNIVKELNLKIELIWWGNHFGTNPEIINFYLEKGIDSAFISTDITKGETLSIVENSIKPLVLPVFGLNQIMYSRRLLMTNYCKYFNIQSIKEEMLAEEKSNIKFRIYEDDKGTVIFNNNIYNGLELLPIPNIKYFYINTAFIDKDIIIELFKNIDNKNFDINSLEIETDNGFLDKKTIYKLNEVSK